MYIHAPEPPTDIALPRSPLQISPCPGAPCRYHPAPEPPTDIALPQSPLQISPCPGASCRYRPAPEPPTDIAQPRSLLQISPCPGASCRYRPAPEPPADIALPRSPLQISPCPGAPCRYRPAPEPPADIALPRSPLQISPCPEAPCKYRPAPEPPADIALPRSPLQISPCPGASCRYRPAPKPPANIALPGASCRYRPAPEPPADIALPRSLLQISPCPGAPCRYRPAPEPPADIALPRSPLQISPCPGAPCRYHPAPEPLADITLPQSPLQISSFPGAPCRYHPARSPLQAANPGCCLEDFVRWYSPRDYIEEEAEDESGNRVIKGELSARMKIPNNMWVEAWETARPTPARRQRRLFDDTKEAEKVLHYLAVQKPADLTRHLLPCVIHAALLKVKEEEIGEDIPSVKSSIKRIISHSSKVLRFPGPEDKKLEDIINQIINVEATIARARSLKVKFGTDRCDDAEGKEDLEKFVGLLLEQPEVPIIGACRGPAGSIVHKMFVNAQRVAMMAPMDEEPKRSSTSDDKKPLSGTDFPSPAGREVILRTTVSRPAPYSKALPQRMYSVLTKDDFRLAGAFSSDTSFF
ncbi:unnamed protein product [Ranitomeya imitator]|uniref:Rab3 GTPase-activating protein catalytic subunit n=1 Tax=Ranitomeya imitator TaxID=111125 RepID=A0ABN9LIL2_9NEOB|nr:unnamed protein product [Ranitomeya imitator]